MGNSNAALKVGVQGRQVTIQPASIFLIHLYFVQILLTVVEGKKYQTSD